MIRRVGETTLPYIDTEVGSIGHQGYCREYEEERGKLVHRRKVDAGCLSTESPKLRNLKDLRVIQNEEIIAYLEFDPMAD